MQSIWKEVAWLKYKDKANTNTIKTIYCNLHIQINEEAKKERRKKYN
jgi:hypothetical protein